MSQQDQKQNAIHLSVDCQPIFESKLWGSMRRCCFSQICNESFELIDLASLKSSASLSISSALLTKSAVLALLAASATNGLVKHDGQISPNGPICLIRHNGLVSIAQRVVPTKNFAPSTIHNKSFEMIDISCSEGDFSVPANFGNKDSEGARALLTTFPTFITGSPSLLSNPTFQKHAFTSAKIL